MYGISSKLTIKAPEQRHLRRSEIFIINFVFIVDFEHVNAGWFMLNLI